MSDFDKKFGSQAYADTGEKQTAATEKLVGDTERIMRQRMGEQGAAIARAVARIEARSFNDFKDQLIPLLAELRAENITQSQMLATLLKIQEELQRKTKENVALQPWMPRVEAIVGDTIKEIKAGSDKPSIIERAKNKRT